MYCRKKFSAMPQKNQKVVEDSSLRKGLSVRKGIKSRDRVRNRGEVFTELREINNILDLTADAHRNYKDQRILEPACGNGNFLVVILERRLADIKKAIKKKNQDDTEFAILTALSTMYGVDIMPDNIKECHERLESIIEKFYKERVSTKNRRPEFFDAVKEILRTNIQLGDMLNGKEKVYFVEYTVPRDYYFVRNEYRLVDLELGILSSKKRIKPTHYLKIGGGKCQRM